MSSSFVAKSSLTLSAFLLVTAQGYSQKPALQPPINPTKPPPAINQLPKLNLPTFGLIQANSDPRRLLMNGGEAQSCVLPPGASSASPEGRLIVTNDYLRPPLKGAALGPVFSQSLNATDGAMLQAQFEALPNGTDYRFGTNDHDVLVTKDGSILYVTGAFTKRPLSPKPAWFDVAYRDDFGPGARSNVMVWRSKDAGKTFQYIGEMDPAHVGDGSFAYPQWLRTKAGAAYAKTTVPGSKDKPVYDMGGSDGQVTIYDPRTQTLYLSFGGVGYLPDTKQKTPFKLSDQRLNKTLVMASTDFGATWTKKGQFDGFSWRFGIAPQPYGEPIFAQWLSTLFVPSSDFSSVATLSSGEGAGWPEFGKSGATKALLGQEEGPVYANIWSHQITGRMPGGKGVFQAYPDMIESKGTKLYGYRVFFYDRKTKNFAELPPILPKRQRTDQVVMHLTAIDPGDGPVLLYWMDIDGENKTASVRSRALIDEDTSSPTVTLSTKNGKQDSFALQSKTWYGDYWTGGGYAAPTRGSSEIRTFVYYPMWVEQGNRVLVSKVTIQSLPDTDTRLPQVVRPPELTRIPLNPKKPLPPDPLQTRQLLDLLSRYEHEERRR